MQRNGRPWLRLYARRRRYAIQQVFEYRLVDEQVPVTIGCSRILTDNRSPLEPPRNPHIPFVILESNYRGNGPLFAVCADAAVLRNLVSSRIRGCVVDGVEGFETFPQPAPRLHMPVLIEVT